MRQFHSILGFKIRGEIAGPKQGQRSVKNFQAERKALTAWGFLPLLACILKCT